VITALRAWPRRNSLSSICRQPDIRAGLAGTSCGFPHTTTSTAGWRQSGESKKQRKRPTSPPTTKATHESSYCIADSKRHLLLVELDAAESFPDICRRAAETMGEANPPIMVGMVIEPPLIVGAPDGGCSTVRPLADAVRGGIPARLSQARHAGPWCTGRFRAFLRVSTCERSDEVMISVSGTDTGDDFVYSKTRDELVSIRRFFGSSTICYGDTSERPSNHCVPTSVIDCEKSDGGR
jgi:hypothetical protein